MGEVNGDFSGELHGVGVDDWERGLPNADDIPPLSQGLIPPELLSAFNIKPEPYRTACDVVKASEDTISSLRGSNFAAVEPVDADDEVVDIDGGGDEMSESKKPRRNESPEDADSSAGDKAAKRTRLVWTPQLHKRFVDVVAHLGIKNAVPKTIMQLMNVEGLTRENVASHLQKYRLYLKRMQGFSFDGGPSNSNSSSPTQAAENFPPPPSENGGGNVPMMPVPMMPVHMMQGYYNGYEAHHNYQQQQNNNYNYNYFQNNSGNHNHNNNNQYNNGMMQSGNKFGAMMPYHHQQHTNNHPHVGDHN